MLAVIAAIVAAPTLSLSLNVPDGGGEPEYIAALREQVRFGLTGSFVSMTWSDLEPTPGAFNKAKFDEQMGFGKFIGGDQLITIKTIDTVKPVLPSDLMVKPFADAELQNRFTQFVERLTPALPKSVKWLSLGNEVDGYLQEKPEAQAAFIKMVRQAREVVHKTRPDIHVGLTVTYGGIKARPAQIRTLLEDSDTLFVTYYPLNADFTPMPPEQVPSQIQSIVDAAGTRNVVLQEFGYPSSKDLGSSEEKQAEFVRQVFKTFPSQPKITFANYYIQVDFSPIQTGFFTQYYGTANPQFVAYLNSLGLRDTKGKPKAALKVFRDQVRLATEE